MYNINYKLSLVGMQLLEKYKENFDVLTSPHIFQVVASVPTKACWYWHYLQCHRQFKMNVQ
jgi:hypothetical protein